MTFKTSRRCRQGIVAVYPLLVNNNQLWVSVLSWWVGSHITEVKNQDNTVDTSSFKEKDVWFKVPERLLVKKMIHSVNMKIFAQTKIVSVK